MENEGRHTVKFNETFLLVTLLFLAVLDLPAHYQPLLCLLSWSLKTNQCLTTPGFSAPFSSEFTSPSPKQTNTKLYQGFTNVRFSKCVSGVQLIKVKVTGKFKYCRVNKRIKEGDRKRESGPDSELQTPQPR